MFSNLTAPTGFARNLLVGLAALFMTLGSASADLVSSQPTMIIYDGSGSMWQELGKRGKYKIAADAVSNIMGARNPGSEIGLIAYGHRRKRDCSDIELLVPLAPATSGQIMRAVKKIQPKGKTPLTDAMSLAAEELNYRSRASHVILITDGLETCEKDPCATARELEASASNFTASVVALGTKGQDTSTLECIADNTGGIFVQANDADELMFQLDQVFRLKEVNELKEEIATVQAELNTTLKLLETSNMTIEDKEAAIRQIEAQVASLTELSDTQPQELATLNSELRSELRKNEQLREEVSTGEATIATLTNDLTVTSAELDRTLGELNTSQSNLAEAGVEIRKLEGDLASTGRDLQATNSALSAEMDKTKNLLNVQASLEKDKADLQSQVAGLNDVIASLQGQLSETRASLEATTAELFQARSDLNDAATREMAQLQKILDTQQRLVLMRRAMEQRASDIMKIRSVLQTSDALIGDLEKATSSEIQELGAAQGLVDLMASQPGN